MTPPQSMPMRTGAGARRRLLLRLLRYNRQTPSATAPHTASRACILLPPPVLQRVVKVEPRTAGRPALHHRNVFTETYFSGGLHG
eukprot:4428882-Prymnesium_polylepis.1